MRNDRLITAVTSMLLIVLSACQPMQWQPVRGSASTEAVDRDRFECENQVLQEYGGWQHVEVFTAAARIQDCMLARGYVQRPAGARSSAPSGNPMNDYQHDPTCRRTNGLPCGTP